MAYLTQNPNQTYMAPVLGQVDMAFQVNVKSCMIYISSTIGYLSAGSPVKLVPQAGKGQIIVDGVTGATDAPYYGVILYNPRKNLYAAGDMCEVGCVGTVVYLESGAAVRRGDHVESAAATSSADPLVTTVANGTDYELGLALDDTTAANDLIRVEIRPSDPALAY